MRQSLRGGNHGLHSCFRVDQTEPAKRAIPECQRSILKSATLAVSEEALLRFLNQLIVLETPPDGFYVLVAAANAEARAGFFNAEVITYALISQQAVALNSKSGDSHLEDLDGALRLFKRLAELDFV